MKKIRIYKENFLEKWKGIRRFYRELILWILLVPSIFLFIGFLFRLGGNRHPFELMWIFFKSNGVLHFFAVTIVITGIMLGINWKWGDPTSWIWKKIGYVWLHVTSTFMCAYFYIGAPKVNLKEVDVYALNEKWEDKMFTREDSLRKKFAYELKLAERPSTVLKEQIKDLNQTIDSFTTATAVLAAAKTDLKKQLALAKADGAIANEKTEAIKASFDSIAKSPTVSGGIQRLKRVPYGALLIVGLLIIISLFSSRFFKDFTMVPVKARRVYIPVVLAGVMLFLCFPYLQSLVWSSSEKRTPQEEVVVQSPKDSIAIPDKKKEALGPVVEIKDGKKQPSLAPTIPVHREKSKKIIPRYSPPQNNGGKMKVHYKKPLCRRAFFYAERLEKPW